MKARVSITIETPFDDDERSVEWINERLNIPDGCIGYSIYCGDISEFSSDIKKTVKCCGS